ncbi:MAG: flagellar type III secretion system pore protein FliP [Planctomycetes bacterium]|nr:flagellar type III secretion system pore protein FliP [Planctomycetota bacterium]
MKHLVAILLAWCCCATTLHAQGAAPSTSEPTSAVTSALQNALQAEALDSATIAVPDANGAPANAAGTGTPMLGSQRMSTAVEIAVLLTALSVLPAVLITITSFTRIIIVLSFVRRALSTNELPPNPVIIGLALFLTTFVMAPTIERIHDKAWVPYRAGQLDLEKAGTAAWGELSTFLVANTRKSELALFADLAKVDLDQSEGEPPPFRVIVPAFVLSELKTAFQMGFLLFLPFLVIDLVVSSVLLSMGMFMLPPVMITTPLKILLFVLVDGWHLVCESLVTSFKVAA